jgi:hypothetical protein
MLIVEDDYALQDRLPVYQAISSIDGLQNLIKAANSTFETVFNTEAWFTADALFAGKARSGHQVFTNSESPHPG